MVIFLILVIVVMVALLVRRFQVAIRGQRLVEPPDAEPRLPVEDHLPLRPSGQVDRAIRAADGIHMRRPQRPSAPDPEDGPSRPI